LEEFGIMEMKRELVIGEDVNYFEKKQGGSA